MYFVFKYRVSQSLARRHEAKLEQKRNAKCRKIIRVACSSVRFVDPFWLSYCGAKVTTHWLSHCSARVMSTLPQLLLDQSHDSLSQLL